MKYQRGNALDLQDTLSSGMIIEVTSGMVLDPWLNTEFNIGLMAFPKDVIAKARLDKKVKCSTLILPSRQETEYLSDPKNLKVQRQLKKIAIQPVAVVSSAKARPKRP